MLLNETQIENLIRFRQDLHAHPEVSGQEVETQKRILAFLDKESTASTRKIGKTGVLATFDSEINGPTIMIRADIDALPITETNTFRHQSTHKGVAHKCGHDGHTTILLGLAQYLTEAPISKGKVLLLFQPAEETGKGAAKVLQDAELQQTTIDYVFALHNLPGFAPHTIVVKENEFTANVKSIIVKITGKTAHAAEPEQGSNPSMAIAKILTYADEITHNRPQATDFFLMTPVYVHLGEIAYGVAAGYGEVHCTLRSWDNELMDQRSQKIVRFIEDTCQHYQLKPEISWTEIFHANRNHAEAVDLIRKAAEINRLSLIEPTHPFRWGEDFGSFTQQYKGAMFGLGAGIDTLALHNPDYDFPDELIATGIRMFYEIIQQIK